MSTVAEEERLRLVHGQFSARMILKLLEKLNERWGGWDKPQAYPDSNLETMMELRDGN